MAKFLRKLFGKVTAPAASTVLDSVGELAKDIRTAITGDIPPEKRASLYEKILDITLEITKVRANIITTEAQGNWMQRSWRPVLMWVCIFIVAWNYIINPLAGLNRALNLPDKLWNLLILGVGGYIAGRSGEKIVDTLRKR